MLSDYLEQLYDSFRDGICVTDRNGMVVLVNRRHSELTGISRDDIVGKHVQSMVDSGVFDTVINARVVRSGEKVSGIQHVYNGRVLMLDGVPIKDDQDSVVYVVTTLRDITALTEMREEITAQTELLKTFQTLNNDNGMPATPLYPCVLQSQEMRSVYNEAAAIADTDATVLLLGETGTGKDVMARYIHNKSKRHNAPFIKVDCGSIPENLIESELFGYVPGSFSGASKQGNAGLVEAASSGTLFLDEIGELPMLMQSRLLRVLQDFEVLRIGATKAKKIDARIIAATNKDLQQEQAKGNFRSDLYYRLKVAVLHMPPLRKRKADILPLTQAFLNYYNKKYGKNARLTEEAERILHNYSWPGNVRELENLVQGLIVTSKNGIIEAANLSSIMPPGTARNSGAQAAAIVVPSIEGRTLKDIMKEVEDKIIAEGLKRYGSVSEMARHFAMDRSTIFRKVKNLENKGS